MTSKYLIAIDPGTSKGKDPNKIKGTGLAIFESGKLVHATTLKPKEIKDPQKKRVELAADVFFYPEHGPHSFFIDVNRPETFDIICEEPMMQGKANQVMQRFLGSLESLYNGRVNYIHPMTLKKIMGSGTLDKLEVALEAGRRLKTSEEQDIIAEAITAEDFDQTDAIAIGVAFLEKQNASQ